MWIDKGEHIKAILEVIPEKPGSYQYYDAKGTIIYVGKAKNLKKRVSSYFNKEPESIKTRVLVKQIQDIKYIVVNTEEDALLLENNLIKQYRPRYNVMLKDDKTYPSIVVKNEYFPRVFTTRNIVRDGSQYYGPYPSAYTAKLMLQMIKGLYPIRSCHLPLTPESIAEGKYKRCLEYHIKRCKAPCEGLQSLEEYQNNISIVKEILKGNVSQVSDILYEAMQKLASELRFEEAQTIKEKYEIIDGQHRWMACLQLHLPIYYSIIEVSDPQNLMIKINANQDIWRLDDYVRFYASRGSKFYNKILEVESVTHWGTSNAITITSGSWASLSSEIRRGVEMEINPHLDEIIFFLKVCKVLSFMENMKFVRAVTRLHHIATQKQIKKLLNNSLLIKQQLSTKDYLISFETLINRNSTNKVKLT